MQISEATGIPIRRVRYVLEHRVLPGADHANRGRRVLRIFTAFEGFGIALAALMLESGTRRTVVADCLSRIMSASGVAKAVGPNQNVPALKAYLSAGPVMLDIGDGLQYRLRTPSRGKPEDGQWLSLHTGKPAEQQLPLVTLQIDIGRLRDMIRRHEK